ncbi:unnamed protein product [Ceratitis capitata]|uniref:(Mediterranean fruit fly) hypothetical protein n=1 Tax=Ceratitis capitata TaxID=7213 RepID=A0A811V900_CERCA|nr:unnamed protein product [Ceratitis capitata]
MISSWAVTYPKFLIRFPIKYFPNRFVQIILKECSVDFYKRSCHFKIDYAEAQSSLLLLIALLFSLISANSLNDVTCSVSSSANGISNVITPMTNIYVFLDTTWQYSTIVDYVKHARFQFAYCLQTVQNLTQTYMNAEKTNSTVGGRSLIALMIPYSTPNQDLFTLNSGSTAASSSAPVVSRIIQIPRTLINPRCGSNWYTPSWALISWPSIFIRMAQTSIAWYLTISMAQAVVAPVSIQSTSGTQFIICTSRYVTLPTQNNATPYNGASSDILAPLLAVVSPMTCPVLATATVTSVNVPPFYLSVQAPTTMSSVSCTDNACQAPNQARYVISVTNMGCYSGVAGLFASFVTIVLAYFLREVLQ